MLFTVIKNKTRFDKLISLSCNLKQATISKWNLLFAVSVFLYIFCFLVTTGNTAATSIFNWWKNLAPVASCFLWVCHLWIVMHEFSTTVLREAADGAGTPVVSLGARWNSHLTAVTRISDKIMSTMTRRGQRSTNDPGEHSPGDCSPLI